MISNLFVGRTTFFCAGLIILFGGLFVTMVYGQTTNPPSLKFAELVDCPLESGEQIKNCVVGYRTTGLLNADSSNTILIPTWLAGSSQELTALTAPGSMADSTKYFVILIDAFGNGISSSPSNSSIHPANTFPPFTIRDMVDAQYRLVTEIIGLNKLYAIVGISMGGMQVFEWIFRYPHFMDKAVPILGSPRLSQYDKMLWRSEMAVLNLGHVKSNSGGASAMKVVAAIHSRNMYTAEYISKMTPNEYQKYLQSMEASIGGKYAEDWSSQLNAMLNHNIYDHFENEPHKAVSFVEAELMIVISKYDHIVDSVPALHFAELSGAKLLELSNDCGHQAVVCELNFVNEKVSEFLKR